MNGPSSVTKLVRVLRFLCSQGQIPLVFASSFNTVLYIFIFHFCFYFRTKFLVLLMQVKVSDMKNEKHYENL